MLLVFYLSLFVVCSLGQTIVVDSQQVLHQVSPTLFGIFFEEINHAGEGGLYAELVQNRAFDALSTSNTGDSRLVSIEASSLANYFVRHCDYLGYATPISSSLDQHDSTFSLTSGLANSTYISFESVNYPGYYLRHYDFRLELAQNDNSQQFFEDASFLLSPALDGSSSVSLQSFNYPGYYLVLNGSSTGGCTVSDKYDIYLEKFEDSQTFKSNATFIIQSPNINEIYPWQVIQEGTATVNITLDNSVPLNSATPYAAKIVASSYSDSSYAGIANPGFWGIYAQQDSYDLSFYAYADLTFISNHGYLICSIESSDGSKVYAKAIVSPLQTTWNKFEVYLQTFQNTHDPNARLVIRLSQEGTVYLDVVSLFPTTFNDRPNGLRKDLANTLQKLGPKFIRFPGGCYVEGSNEQTAFSWKNSTGPIAERPGHYSYWGYWSTDGLGFLEYLIMCRDLGAIPIWVAHVGIFTGDSSIPFEDIDPWIQDALDSIEYANGNSSTFWGSKRVADGHPDPFNIEIMALGNENGCSFDSKHIYVQYYEAFAIRIRSLYPNIKLIANCDISSDTKYIDYFDVHLYESPQWFVDNANMFDSYSRNGPKAFVSEYAVTSECGNGNLQAAIGEAAFMIGLVRNSDVVALASYAPLFVNVNNRQWNPDAIQFNNSAIAPTPSYYTQKLFMQYTGSFVLQTNNSLPEGISSIATFNNVTGNIYIAVVNFSPNSTEINLQIVGAQKVHNIGQAYILTNSNPLVENSLDAPNTVVPYSISLQVPSPSFHYSAPCYSVSILIITAAF